MIASIRPLAALPNRSNLSSKRREHAGHWSHPIHGETAIERCLECPTVCSKVTFLAVKMVIACRYPAAPRAHKGRT